MKRRGIPVCALCGVPWPETPPPCPWCPARPVENPSEDSEWWPCGHCGKPVDRPHATTCWRCVAVRRHITVLCQAPRHKGDRKTPAYMARECTWVTAFKKETRRGLCCQACIGSGEVQPVSVDTPPEALALEPKRPKPPEWSLKGTLAGRWTEKGKQTLSLARGKHAVEHQFETQWTHGSIQWTDGDGFQGTAHVAYDDLRHSGIEPQELTHDYIALFGDGVRVFCVEYVSRETMVADLGHVSHSRDAHEKYLFLFDDKVWRQP